MKGIKKIVIIIVLSILVVLAYFQLVYNPCGYGSAKGFFNNSSQHEYSLVIVNEGSHFKDSVTRILVNYYEPELVQVKVIPLTSLSKLKVKDFSAVVVLHSWHTWNPPPEVASFIKEQRACLNKIVVLTTSSEGTLKMDEVDAITGASRVEEATKYANKIIEKVNPLLGLE
ncbi:MAG: hypothetical protein WD554_04750 [Flavobacteriaceae bacterium]